MNFILCLKINWVSPSQCICVTLGAICYLSDLNNITNTVRWYILYLSTDDQKVKTLCTLLVFCFLPHLSAFLAFHLVHLLLPYSGHTASEPLPSVPTQILSRDFDVSCGLVSRSPPGPSWFFLVLDRDWFLCLEIIQQWTNLPNSPKNISFLYVFLQKHIRGSSGETISAFRGLRLMSISQSRILLCVSGCVRKGEFYHLAFKSSVKCTWKEAFRRAILRHQACSLSLRLEIFMYSLLLLRNPICGCRRTNLLEILRVLPQLIQF